MPLWYVGFERHQPATNTSNTRNKYMDSLIDVVAEVWVIKSEEEIELGIWLLVMLTYPTNVYNPMIPKKALMEQNHYWVSITDTMS